MNDKVSIIITTYGGKECIKQAVESCLNQTYKNIEIIVVDDSGKETEGQRITEKILRPYITLNKILYIAHDKNKNASAARNTGFYHSTGKFIALLDDDDQFTHEKIERQVRKLQNLPEEYGVVYCSMEDIVDNQVYEYQAISKGDVLYKFLMMKVAACTSNIMIRRSVYEKVKGFDESFDRHQDWEFLARVASVSKFYGIDYVGTIKKTKNIVKRYSATQAEVFRLHYIELIKTPLIQLNQEQKKKVLSHEYNELAKLFIREKKFKKAMNYIILSKRPEQFLKDFILKPIHIYKQRITLQKTGKVVYKR